MSIPSATAASTLFYMARLVDMKTVQLANNTKASLLHTMLQQQLAKSMRLQLDKLFTTKLAQQVQAQANKREGVYEEGGATGVTLTPTPTPTTPITSGTAAKETRTLSDIVFDGVAADSALQRTLSTDEFTSNNNRNNTPLNNTPLGNTPLGNTPLNNNNNTPLTLSPKPPKLTRTVSVIGKRKHDDHDDHDGANNNNKNSGAGIRLKRSRSIPSSGGIATPNNTPNNNTTKYTVLPVMLDGAMRLVFLSAEAVARMTANGTQSLASNLSSVLRSRSSSSKRIVSSSAAATTSTSTSTSLSPQPPQLVESAAYVPAFA